MQPTSFHHLNVSQLREHFQSLAVTRQNRSSSNEAEEEQTPSAPTEEMIERAGKVIHAFPAEAVFTQSSCIRCVAATFSCNECIALGGYEATNKIAFVIHIIFAEQLPTVQACIIEAIEKLAKKALEQPIQMHIRGGLAGSDSESTVGALRSWIETTANPPMRIASENTLLLPNQKPKGESLFIDARTGGFGEYDFAAESSLIDENTLVEEAKRSLERLYECLSPFSHLYVSYPCEPFRKQEEHNPSRSGEQEPPRDSPLSRRFSI
jgi:hypothetical protein